MAQHGDLIEWNDERGFGFIQPDGGGPRLFVHISQIGRIATRPQLGDRISYAVGRGRDGKSAAVDVSIAGANPVKARALARGTLAGAPRSAAKPDWLRAYLGLSLVALLSVGWLAGSIPTAVAAIYLLMSLVSAGFYSLDKRRAAAGQWRISEARLHAIDLLFGIAGGLFAQQLLRHKTAKRGFAAKTYAIAIVHGLWLAAFVTGAISFRELAAFSPG